ncbi:srg family chemoreceptor domain-containing protein [Ditylenchus destructor]|nr:srg family chemoreceptor domain-containing protein [Ditylenchus destructor]
MTQPIPAATTPLMLTTTTSGLVTTTNFVGRCPPDAANCHRIFEPWEIVTVSIAVPVFCFHCLMFYFLVRQVLDKHPYFNAPFYKLYLVLTFVEILHALEESIYLRVITSGLPFVLDIFEGNVMLARIGYFLSGYFAYFQCFAHVVLAVNRFTVFAFPLRYQKIWNTRTIVATVVGVTLLPWPFLSFRISAEAIYFYVGPNQLGNKYVDQTVRFYSGLTSACIATSTSIVSAIFEIFALVMFKRLTKRFPNSEDNRTNARLLACTILMLISQAILTTYHLLMMYGTFYNAPGVIAFAQRHVTWVFDQFSLHSSLCLCIASKDVRRSFLNFYNPKKDKTTSSAVFSFQPTLSGKA